jgi:hypothetical protein
MIDNSLWIGGLSALCFVVGVVLAKLFRSQQWDMTQVRTVITMLVQEAEQTMQREPGEERLAWVLQRADALGLTRHVPAPLLSAMIESAVWLVNQKRQPIIKPELNGKPMFRDRSN